MSHLDDVRERIAVALARGDFEAARRLAAHHGEPMPAIFVAGVDDALCVTCGARPGEVEELRRELAEARALADASAVLLRDLAAATGRGDLDKSGLLYFATTFHFPTPPTAGAPILDAGGVDLVPAMKADRDPFAPRDTVILRCIRCEIVCPRPVSIQAMEACGRDDCRMRPVVHGVDEHPLRHVPPARFAANQDSAAMSERADHEADHCTACNDSGVRGDGQDCRECPPVSR